MFFDNDKMTFFLNKHQKLRIDWRVQTAKNLKPYSAILRWFLDWSTPKCYYSIHQIAKCGTMFDKSIGEWFGPSTIAQVLV